MSSNVELKTTLDQVPRILGRIKEVAKGLDTVVSVGVSSRCDHEGNDPLEEILKAKGYPVYRGKTNLGVGRATCQAPIPSSSAPASGGADDKHPTVLPETWYLLNAYLGQEAERRFVASCARGELIIETVTSADLRRCLELLETYADANIGFVDASVIAIAERLNVRRLLTTDRRDFSLIHPRHCPALELLPRIWGICSMHSSATSTCGSPPSSIERAKVVKNQIPYRAARSRRWCFDRRR